MDSGRDTECSSSCHTPVTVDEDITQTATAVLRAQLHRMTEKGLSSARKDKEARTQLSRQMDTAMKTLQEIEQENAVLRDLLGQKEAEATKLRQSLGISEKKMKALGSKCARLQDVFQLADDGSPRRVLAGEDPSGCSEVALSHVATADERWQELLELLHDDLPQAHWVKVTNRMQARHSVELQEAQARSALSLQHSVHMAFLTVGAMACHSPQHAHTWIHTQMEATRCRVYAWLGIEVVAGHDVCTVSVVSDRSPASAAGVRQGDILDHVDGALVRCQDDLRAELRPRKPGDVVHLTLRRGDELLNLAATLAARAAPSGRQNSARSRTPPLASVPTRPRKP
eukprot:NODE_1474_length_1322_cov_49.495397_g1461_i0.p1 GENE.NODE_1474_length_1322_cov_49.495397_g1461_i0~~NODE_1474_length_1322_cov_49.495397_g1461_i0.p1  ORF type:complete len:395 (-),score=107.15 NODE_1474_length_1322_cov_49.495397_g1461_i0:136-1161(-)